MTVTLQPTPPTLDKGPFVEINLYGVPGNELTHIRAGHWEGIPQLWRISSVYMELVTDATVVNRYIWTIVRNNITKQDMLSAFNGAAVAASSTQGYSLGDQHPINNMNAAGTQHGRMVNWTMYDDNYLEFNIINGQAGDAYELHVVLEYLNKKYGIKTPYDEVNE